MSSERAKALLAHIDAGDIDAAESMAEVLWAMDRDGFWQLLTDEVVRRRHSMELGLVLMRTVRHLPRPDHESLSRVFIRAVQRLVPEEPRQESQEFVECAQQLKDASTEKQAPAWLIISSASAHLHHFNWLASNDEVVNLTASLATINGLLTEATERYLLPREHLQLAATMGQYAGLTGDARWLKEARASLAVVEERYPALAPQWVIPILIQFAKAIQQDGLWHEIIERGALLLQQAEVNDEEISHHQREVAHYHLAVAYTGLGKRATALTHLAMSVALNPQRIHLAVSDGDMAPLFYGAGTKDYDFDYKPDKH